MRKTFKIALIILHIKKSKNNNKNKNICLAYTLNFNLECEKEITPMMISDGEKWHHLTATKLFALSKGTTTIKITVVFIAGAVFIHYNKS